MSDAYCGPSNPLQQFKQQTQLDRTLQQDRLASRQSPAQGFRSANPSAGHLDPEFEAFQAGVPPSELSHFPSFQQPPQNYGGPPQAPAWAADFQQMHVSSPPPFQQQQMPQQLPSTANWAQGFREHHAQTPPRGQMSASSPQQFQQMARHGGMNGFQSSFAQPSMTPGFLSKGKDPAAEEFDQAAFIREFDQAMNDMKGGAEREAFSSDNVHQEGEAAYGSQQGDVGEKPPVNGMQDMLMEQQDRKRALFTSPDQDQMQQSANQQQTDVDMATDNARPNQTMQDWQRQLMFLQQQNKERLLAARAEQEKHSDMEQVGTNGVQSDAQQEWESQQIVDPQSETRWEYDESGISTRVDADERMESMQDPHQIRQEALEEQAEPQERAKEDDDALAATAHELLEKVQHNQTDKFRNSQFLGLMRKLRDREVKVEGDKMVETNNVRSAHNHLQPPQAPSTPHPDLLSATATSERAGFVIPRAPPEFDSHFELGWPDVEHDYDHWESPYR